MYLSVLYTADEGLRGRNVLQLVVDWFCYVFAHNQFAYSHGKRRHHWTGCRLGRIHCPCLEAWQGDGVYLLGLKAHGQCSFKVGAVSHPSCWRFVLIPFWRQILHKAGYEPSISTELGKNSKQYVVINTHERSFEFRTTVFRWVYSQYLQFSKSNGKVSCKQFQELSCTRMICSCQARMKRSIYASMLEQVLVHLEEAGLHLNWDKCEFMARSVAYLGHVADAQGLQHDSNKVRAINDGPWPRSVSELKSYLGLLAYYSKFLADLATVDSVTHHCVWAMRKREHSSVQAVVDRSRSLIVHLL